VIPEILRHRIDVVVAFDPPRPSLKEQPVVYIETAFFPNQPGGVAPEDLR
jgi:hypothetical protein